MSRTAHLVLALSLVLVNACGDDEPPPPPPPGTPGSSNPASAAAAAAAAGGGPVGALIPRIHIEDRVSTSEKATIRHVFKERDFAADTNRDPFQSFIVTLPGTPNPALDPNLSLAGQQCTKADQLVATKFSYSELQLVGIVAEGTQRKVLMMDPSNYGRIIKRGDCVGKEKALVKDIGTGYVTFVVMPDSSPNSQARPPEEHSVQLHANDLTMPEYQIPGDQPPRTVAPVMPPTSPVGPIRPTLPMPAPVPTPAGTPASPSSPPVKT